MKSINIPIELLNDDISLKAIGLYVFLISKDKGYRININNLSKTLNEGTFVIAKTLKELRLKNWIYYNNKNQTYTLKQ